MRLPRLALSAAALCLSLLGLAPATVYSFENYITASGDKLMDGSREYRFISFNVPTLNYQEDELEFKTTNPYALPTEFEMRDVFATVKEMGGQVIRIYTVPVRNRNFPPEAPTYVEAPGSFNEEAFKVTDRMLALANKYGIRIIFSLLNNHQWMGGRPNYAAFRGKTAEEFWTDRQLIEDFKATITFTVNRRNTITGVPYKDDKAILCWETGNELACPDAWTAEIARHIKSLDQNHLVMDGFFAIDDVPIRTASLSESAVDIVTSHHYERDPAETLANIRRNYELIGRRKPYLVGELGFASTPAIQHLFRHIIETPGICGGLVWSLRHHREKGGFYWHSEPLGIGIYKAYHFPGFESGVAYDEKNFLAMMRREAFAIQGLAEPPLSVPAAPKLLPVENVFSISWQGSAGGSGYDIERAPSAEGPWTTVGLNVSDAQVPYFPLFQDVTAELGQTYWYRVRALGGGCSSAPSNAVGPVRVTQQALIDTGRNMGTLYEAKNVTPVTGNDRGTKELLWRLAGDYGSEATYRQPGKLDRFQVWAFEKNRFIGLQIFGSKDGKVWTDLKLVPKAYVNAETNYNYLQPKLYTYESGENYEYLKIFFRSPVQIGRVEAVYSK